MFMLMVPLLLADLPAGLPTLGKPVGDISAWIRESDYRPEMAGVVHFKTIFTTEGTPDRCAITATTGNRTLETLVCSLAVKRFRFNPSLASDGRPTYRVLERMANFAGGTLPKGFGVKPLYTLPANSGMKAGRVVLVVDVAADGRLRGCTGNPADKRSNAVAPRACEAIAPLWQPLLERNGTGQAIGYVRDISVEVVEPAVSAVAK